MVKSVRFLWSDPELPPDFGGSSREFRFDEETLADDEHSLVPSRRRRVRPQPRAAAHSRRDLAAAAELDPPSRHRRRG